MNISINKKIFIITHIHNDIHKYILISRLVLSVIIELPSHMPNQIQPNGPDCSRILKSNMPKVKAVLMQIQKFPSDVSDTC